MPARRDEVAGWLRFQARGCAALGSPFYGSLLDSATADLEAGGPVWDVLGELEGESEWSALALRLMAAMHRAGFRPIKIRIDPLDRDGPQFAERLGN